MEIKRKPKEIIKMFPQEVALADYPANNKFFLLLKNIQKGGERMEKIIEQLKSLLDGLIKNIIDEDVQKTLTEARTLVEKIEEEGKKIKKDAESEVSLTAIMEKLDRILEILEGGKYPYPYPEKEEKNQEKREEGERRAFSKAVIAEGGRMNKLKTVLLRGTPFSSL